jgi:hypothetical protein
LDASPTRVAQRGSRLALPKGPHAFPRAGLFELVFAKAWDLGLKGIRVETGRQHLQGLPLSKLGEDPEFGVQTRGERLIWVETAVVEWPRNRGLETSTGV